MPENVQNPATRTTRARTKGRVLILMAVVFVSPAAFAFVNKFFKFIRTMDTDEMGAIALVPMLNYLAVAAGFLCLLVWAVSRGMFKDVEGPKFELLANEDRLDQADALSRSK